MLLWWRGCAYEGFGNGQVRLELVARKLEADRLGKGYFEAEEALRDTFEKKKAMILRSVVLIGVFEKGRNPRWSRMAWEGVDPVTWQLGLMAWDQCPSLLGWQE